jgi:hypothetical protein
VVDVSSFDAGEVTLSGPDGDHPAIGVVPTNASFTQFDVLFAPLTAAGTYQLIVGPTIADVYGNLMDQDGNLVPGESTDAYTTTFTLLGPQVTATTVAPGRPVDHALVTFDRPMDPSTFSMDSFALAGPDGSPIAITGASAVPFTNNTQFEVDFDPSNAIGRYTLTVHAGVADVYGNVLAADLTTSFTVQVNYTAAATDFQNIELQGQDGVQAVTFTSGSQYADDDYGVINLGSNSVNFYGTTYNQLFVSSNGLITFGSGNSEYRNSDLSPGGTTPSQPAIAPLWSDWLKNDDGSGPMILWTIRNNQLIIEWNRIQHYPGSQPITFQVILDLNTGGQPGDIVFNYDNLNTGGSDANGQTSTVGVNNPLGGTTLVSFDSSNPLVGSGKALRLSAS